MGYLCYPGKSLFILNKLLQKKSFDLLLTRRKKLDFSKIWKNNDKCRVNTDGLRRLAQTTDSNGKENVFIKE